MIEMNRLKSCLAIEFELKDLGSMKYFLGMEVAHSKKAMEICIGSFRRNGNEWLLTY